jgi:hypothetical protein
MNRLDFAARHSCDSPEWYTPAPFAEAARRVMGAIDLDPMSHAQANLTVKATRFYTVEEDGLRQPWAGRIFLNPPGGERGRLVSASWRRLIWHWERGLIEQAIWIGYSLEQLQTLQVSHPSFTPLDCPLCVPFRRISFVENDAQKSARIARLQAQGKTAGEAVSPSHANYICYLGPDSSKFVEVFTEWGQCLRP